MSGTATVAEPVAPKSLAAFVRLCEEHGDLMVTRDDSFEVGNCTGDTDRFIQKYLQGRTEVPLRDLIPFIKSSHEVWTHVMDVVVHRLEEENALEKRYSRQRSKVWEPSRKRNVDLN